MDPGQTLQHRGSRLVSIVLVVVSVLLVTVRATATSSSPGAATPSELDRHCRKSRRAASVASGASVIW
jgi:hypothetical protein